MVKILLSCPVSTFKDYCLPAWLEHVKLLQKPAGCQVDLYFVDNSPQPYAVPPGQYEVDTLPSHGKRTPQILAESWNMIREKVLNEGYDYHFSLECDVFPPPDVMPRLLARMDPLLIVGGWYFVKSKDQTTPMILRLMPAGEGVMNLEFDHPRIEYLRLAQANGLMEVDGMGQGCVMVHRSVLEQISFRHENNKHHPDMYFYQDLLQAGYVPYVDSTILCEHHNQDWDYIDVLKNVTA